MINKKNMWFLTLFSLILVLSVYYVTMPTEILLNTSSTNPDKIVKEVKEVNENASLVALRVEKEEEALKELNILSGILTSKDSSVLEKNDAYDKMKDINIIKSEEQKLEELIKKELNIESVITIDGDKIKVTAISREPSTSLANDIMRKIQGNYKNKMYVTVKFEQ